MKKKLAIFVLSQFLLAGWADAQQAYFIDAIMRYLRALPGGTNRLLSPRN